MGYKPPKQPKKRSQQVLAGRDLFEDSYGRVWLIKAEPLATIHRFYSTLALIVQTANNANWIIFLGVNLYNPSPSLWTRFRRMLGMADYSFRHIAKHFPAKDRIKVRDAITVLNLDKNFDEYIKSIEDEVKKKIAARKAGKESKA